MSQIHFSAVLGPPATDSAIREDETPLEGVATQSACPEDRPYEELRSDPILGDRELVEGALAQRPGCREAIYRKHSPRLFAWATRLLGSADAAEDVLHDTFVSAFEKLHKLRDANALRGWLSQILLNHARAFLRKERLRQQIGLSTLVPEEAYVPEGRFELDGRLAWRDLTRLLRRLSPEARIAWWLQRVEKHTIPEVAVLTESSVDRVKKHLSAVERHISSYREGEGLA